MTEQKQQNGIYLKVWMIRMIVGFIIPFVAVIIWLGGTHMTAFANKDVIEKHGTKISENSACIATIQGELKGMNNLLEKIYHKLG